MKRIVTLTRNRRNWHNEKEKKSIGAQVRLIKKHIGRIAMDKEAEENYGANEAVSTPWIIKREEVDDGSDSMIRVYEVRKHGEREMCAV